MSFVVKDFYKIKQKDFIEIHELLMNVKSQYEKLLVDYTADVILKNLNLFKTDYIYKYPNKDFSLMNEISWIKLCYKELYADVIKSRDNPMINWDSLFCLDVDNYNVNCILYVHPIDKNIFIQFFGGLWAKKNIINFIDGLESYEFSDASDSGYEDNMQKMENDRKYLEEIFKTNKTFSDAGLTVVLSNSLPKIQDVINKIKEKEEKLYEI